MNANHVLGPATWAASKNVPQGGGGVHFGIILLALIVLGGLGFGVTRMRRGRPTAQHDDEWGRGQPQPSAPPPVLSSQPVLPSPPGLSGPAGPVSTAVPPGVGPAGEASTAPSPARAAAVPVDAPAGRCAVETHSR